MRGEDATMMLNMTEADYESWRDDLRCGGREEYDASILRRPCTKAVGGPMQFPT